MTKALEVTGLTKSYGSKRAVENLSFSVDRGEIFGLLGHNGAGKTTTIECVLGTRKPDGGTIRILGKDPGAERKRLFARVGVQFQQTGYQDKITLKEACEVTAALYPRPGDYRQLLSQFGMEEHLKKPVRELSGGERQKLSVLLALIPDPEILFLDELTTGLDPGSRRDMWEYLKKLEDQGVTILLTSHYMDEVEYLCDRILLLKKGISVVEGTPEELVMRHKTKNLEDVFLLYTRESDKEEEQDENLLHAL